MAGKLANHIAKWREITSVKWVLDCVQHCRIEFIRTPWQAHIPKELQCGATEGAIITASIADMLQKGAIVQTVHTAGEFLSNIFIRPKKDGSFRPIINLKGLNAFVAHFHFKMETIRTAIQLIRPQCYMASVDLKDAYFAVPIASEHRKYLRFTWRGVVYEFTCLPFGLSSAPRVFTKVMKPLIASLRMRGHESCDYLDDALLVGRTFQECRENVRARTSLTRSLGFTVNYKKSALTPTKHIDFLGFHLDSERMTISLPHSKVHSIIALIQQLLQQQSPKIRDVARVIGLLVSCEIQACEWVMEKKEENLF